MVKTKTVVIVCETMRDEFTDAVSKCGCDFETHWIESGLHNFPDKLRNVLQQKLDEITAAKVLLCFGTCGNSVVGLETREYELILPRVDDCISLLLGSASVRAKISAEHAAYFLTAGWLRGERNIYVEYEYTINKYGEELGRSIMSMMLANYRKLALLDTGSYDIEPARLESAMIAEKLGLDLQILPASVGYISELLSGPHSPERFFVFPPHTKIESLTVV